MTEHDREEMLRDFRQQVRRERRRQIAFDAILIGIMASMIGLFAYAVITAVQILLDLARHG